jgi:hypothetical protein
MMVQWAIIFSELGKSLVQRVFQFFILSILISCSIFHPIALIQAQQPTEPTIGMRL